MSVMVPELTDLQPIDMTELFPYENKDDANWRTHIVNPPANLHIWQEGMSAQDVVDTARMMGFKVTALCGFTWVPKHNPDKFPVCDSCMKIAGQILGGE